MSPTITSGQARQQSQSGPEQGFSIPVAGFPMSTSDDGNDDPVSARRRQLLAGFAAAGSAGAALWASGPAQAMGPATEATRGDARAAPGLAGRKFRAWILNGSTTSIQQLTLRPISGRQVVVRMQAAPACYTLVGNAGLGSENRVPLGPQAARPPNPAGGGPHVLGTGGVGIVEAVGPEVRRVRPGDRVVTAGAPQCGQCYECLRGRSDMCAFVGIRLEPDVHWADLADGTPVLWQGGVGGFTEYSVQREEWLVPIFSSVSSEELAALSDNGATGLGATMTMSPIAPGSDVVVMGCGSVGLAAVQGARVCGAAQIIAIDPVRYRREAALRLGATLALDPNAEGDQLLAHIRQLCSGPTDRRFSGGRDGRGGFLENGVGPDYVIEAVGNTVYAPKVESPQDLTGLVALRQAWEMTNSIGHLVTMGLFVGEISLPVRAWAISGRTHHAAQLGGSQVMRDLPRYVRLIERGLVDMKSTIATYPLEKTTEAFQAVADRTVLNAIVTMGASQP
jgi:S-(hydroxymethyl)glutathione dehydrogenase/alcohol dehydrogenase